MRNICQKPQNCFFFGSRTKGTHRPFSDIDLLVDAGKPLTLAERDALISAFEESLLPFKVDMADACAIGTAFMQAIQPQLVPFEHHHLPARDT
ncbi:DNA polymerase, beta-like region [Legionella geestiana]|uniref:DNA polymerase, beta-like region n=1 Tax=Legionella geestiana TaxID=45065 RepID=A0A0W0TQ07_9GAMM|nr:nucleotidyltransferase domain-containing protein [Legionella geestiana]KTC97365.1 DNA polymerase, beta-like region [Legionella geestiana]